MTGVLGVHPFAVSLEHGGPNREGLPEAYHGLTELDEDLLSWLLVWDSGLETRAGQLELCLEVLIFRGAGYLKRVQILAVLAHAFSDSFCSHSRQTDKCTRGPHWWAPA